MAGMGVALCASTIAAEAAGLQLLQGEPPLIAVSGTTHPRADRADFRFRSVNGR